MKYRILIQGKDTPQVGVDECRVRGGAPDWHKITTECLDWDVWEFRRPIPEPTKDQMFISKLEAGNQKLEIEGIKEEPTDNVNAVLQKALNWLKASKHRDRICRQSIGIGGAMCPCICGLSSLREGIDKLLSEHGNVPGGLTDSPQDLSGSMEGRAGKEVTAVTESPPSVTERASELP